LAQQSFADSRLYSIYIMSAMIAAAEMPSRGLPTHPEDEFMSRGYNTCFDPCCMPRRPGVKPEPKPIRKSTLQFPADANGQPLAMEYHDPVTAETPLTLLRARFGKQASIEDLKAEHEGHIEAIDYEGGKEHLEHGWTAENDKKFRETEELCRALFGGNWDARYGRTRVRSAETGEVLIWGAGKTMYDKNVQYVPPPPTRRRSLQPVPTPPPPKPVLRRGDTEIRFTTSNVKAIPHVEVPHYPHFPPPKMHQSYALPGQPPYPTSSRLNPHMMMRPRGMPPADEPADQYLPADFGAGAPGPSSPPEQYAEYVYSINNPADESFA
jgi:hypothetical protein